MTLVQRSFSRAAWIAVLVVSAASASVACNRDHVDRDGFAERNFDPAGGDRVGTTTVTGADVGVLTSDLAVERIVAARCARESACNNVGADKHFVDNEACAHSLQSKLADDLKPSECPRGIDAAAADRCMDAIRTESCNNPIDTISRLAACRTSDMCLKPASTKK
jgi:hypothetical protein